MTAQLWVGTALSLMALLSVGRAADMDFAERFAFPETRAAALEELIPGSDEYYFYQALHAQNEQRLDQVPPLLEPWRKRHGNTAKLREIENRQLLLQYAQRKQETLSALRHKLGLRHDHPRDAAYQPDHAPSRLDPTKISTEAFRQQALGLHKDLGGFEDAGLDGLVAADLTPQQRRELLRRVRLPDIEGLLPLVIAELRERDSRGFGALPIHNKLTLEQLEACRHALRGQDHDPGASDAFVAAILARLAPSPDLDVAADPVARREYLERVYRFAESLPASRNDLKVATLYRLLEHDRAQGRYDAGRFAAYLRLPRAVPYMRRAYLERREFAGRAVSLDKTFSNAPLLPPIVNDEPLVRDYLAHFLREVDHYRAFADWLDEDYLKRVFAETKILAGIGDMERWYEMMPPEAYQALRDRVDIDLLPENPRYFDADAKVTLSVALKNVDTLRLDVFDIEAFDYYRIHNEEIGLDVDLDGCVPNHATTLDFANHAPLRRHVERIPVPGIDRPGLYIVELSGNGVSSRALIRKGRLRCVERIGAAGHVFSVLDDQGTILSDATLWLDGQIFAADPNGEIVVPFGTQDEGGDPFAPADDKAVILRHGRLATRTSFRHLPERYDLRLGWILERECLVAGEEATLILRPALTVQGRPAALSLLQDPAIELRLRDADGITALQRIESPELRDDSDFSHRFRVPARLRQVEVRMSGRVRNLSRQREDSVEASFAMTVNGMQSSERIGDLYLRRLAEGYRLEARGRNGEALAARSVRLAFKHRLFRDPLNLLLQSDAEGHIFLGPLPEIETITALDFAPRAWTLIPGHGEPFPAILHLAAGERLELPATSLTTDVPRDEISLLQLGAADAFVADFLDHARLQNGLLILENLPPGDYQLTLRRHFQRLRLRVTEAPLVAGALAGTSRGLAATATRPLRIAEMTASRGKLRLRIEGAGPETRLHLLARRIATDGDPAASYRVGMPEIDPAIWSWPRLPGSYQSGRAIGDETRYVLDRREAARIPGTMLPRPSLILNPWSTRETETDVLQAAAGEQWNAEPSLETVKSLRSPSLSRARYSGRGVAPAPNESCLDFLPQAAGVWSNLRPDEQGTIEIDLREIAGRQELIALAADALTLAQHRLVLDGGAFEPRDLRLAHALDPEASHAGRKEARGLPAGETFRLDNARGARVEVYDSIGAAMRLFQALEPNPEFDDFAFLATWHKLSDERRSELYGRFACHELNFFLYHKDREFFDRVVAPLLANKRDKQFMDHWLLDRDLSEWTRPGVYQQLNALERILLGRRLHERQEAIARQMVDLCNLLPPDPDGEEYRFQTALRSGGRPEVTLDGVEMEEGGDIPMEIAFGAKPAASRPAAKPPEALKRLLAADRSLADAATESAGQRASEARAGDARRREESIRQLYRAPETTREWIETHYHRLTLQDQGPARVPVNAFWRDYAAAGDDRPFLSGHLAQAAGSVTERLCALAVLDLPFQAGERQENVDGDNYSLQSESHCLVYCQRILPSGAGDPSRPIMAVENFFDLKDRYRMEGGEKHDKFVRDEFVAGRPYGARVVLTNPTSSRRHLALLAQVPQGAIPLSGGQFLYQRPIQLDPYETTTFEYTFYFPQPVRVPAPHLPATVSESELVMGRAAGTPFRVVAVPTQLDRASWEYVSQQGSEEDVLDYLARENIHAPEINLERIAWRLRERDFFRSVTSLLEQRGIFNRTVWGYALLHDDLPRIRQLLASPGEPFRLACGRHLRSDLLEVNAERFLIYEHKEYWPLVNARAHRLGRRRQIANQEFAAQYREFLDTLAYRPRLNARERLAAAAYLLLQDRTEEAQAQFAMARPEDVDTRMQYDYLSAYLAFSRGQPEEARRIAAAYAEYPVPRWRDRFKTVLAQADEIAGADAAPGDTDRREEAMDFLAAGAPSLDLSLEGDQVTIRGVNLGTCTARLYPIDIELLFSRGPFMTGGEMPGRFTVTRPAWQQQVALPPDGQANLPLPEEFKTRNLIVEVSAPGAEHRQVSHTPHAMELQLLRNYGQLRLRRAADGHPVAGAYVKVYARGNQHNAAVFYKDGYTDLRGRFDYASISTPDLDDVTQFSILVLHEDLGAIIRQTPPPPR